MRVVYFARRESDGAIKIGCTANTRERTAVLRYVEKCRIDLLGTLPGWVDEEAHVQAMFAAHRLDGEWFAPVPDLLAFAAAPDYSRVPFGPLQPRHVYRRPLRFVVPASSPTAGEAA